MGINYDAQIIFGVESGDYLPIMEMMSWDWEYGVSPNLGYIYGLTVKTIKEMMEHAFKFVEFVNFMLAKQNKDVRVEFDRDTFDFDWTLTIGKETKNKQKSNKHYAPIDTEDPQLDSYILEWLKVDADKVEFIAKEGESRKAAKKAKYESEANESLTMNLRDVIKSQEDFMFVSALKNKQTLGFYVTYYHSYAFEDSNTYEYGPNMILLGISDN